MKTISVLSLLVISSLAWGHARMMNPVPRNNNAGIKNGPCGGLARSATPMVIQGGTMMMFQWEETINHPGKFLFSLSTTGNDQNFALMAMVPDDQNLGNNLPHRFQAQVMIPNINCPNCTIQMIQSMEENPAVPSFYYSCADVSIVAQGAPVPTPPPAPSPTPTPGGEVIQSSGLPQQQNGVKFGQGCGTVKSVAAPQVGLNWILACLLFMLIPAMAWFRLRAVSISSKYK